MMKGTLGVPVPSHLNKDKADPEVSSAPPATRKVYWGRKGPSLELFFSAVSY